MKLSLVIQTPEVKPTIPVALLLGSFKEKAAKAAYLGADGVELMTADPAALDVAAVRGTLERFGLRIAAIGSGAVALAQGLTLLDGDAGRRACARARLRDLIYFASSVGAPLVTIGGFRGRLANAGPARREYFAPQYVKPRMWPKRMEFDCAWSHLTVMSLISSTTSTRPWHF
jgi:sugar phosphate isomerase/epimerase